MNNTKAAAVGIGVFLILSIGLYLSWPSIQANLNRIPLLPTMSPTPTTSGTVKETKGIFTLEATYEGNNTWEYEVSATLPNPCTTATVDVIVAESYPEQVSINVKTKETGGYCIQTTKDYIYVGTFQASEAASVQLRLVP